MGTGYTRADTGNNIADGNVVNASDLDAEYDAIEAAFNASTGHTHDGTSAEGAPIEVAGPAQDLVITATEVRPKTDNTLDLGTTTLEFKDAFFDGTVKTDTLTVDENATVTGNLTVNGNTTLGNAATDTVTVTADVASDLIPSADGTYDLGASGSEWQDLYIDGTANIDSLVADTADINAGSIDGATLGTNSAITEAQIDNININGNAITSTDTNGNIALTPDGTGEVDISKVDIDSGTIDDTTIGGSTPAAGSFTTFTSTGIDDNATSTAITIDSSENVLVGKTSIGTANVGTEARANGLLQATRDGGNALELNRKTSDGTIIDLRKDGTTVGSIGNNGSILKIDGSSSGIFVGGSGASIWPQSDNTHDLGTSGLRFQDLYLSGGVYLGGTGAANQLDDYEEGTWTPSFSNGTNVTFSSQSGKYTKIGRMVYISAKMTISNSDPDVSGVHLVGLPFTTETSEFPILFHLGQNFDFLNVKVPIGARASSSGTTLFIFESDGNFITFSECASSGDLEYSAIYEASS